MQIATVEFVGFMKFTLQIMINFSEFNAAGLFLILMDIGTDPVHSSLNHDVVVNGLGLTVSQHKSVTGLDLLKRNKYQV